MKPGRTLAVLACTIAQLVLGPPMLDAQDELDVKLARLQQNRFDEPVVYALEAHKSDPRIIPALEAAFSRRTEKREKQILALTLLRLGETSQKYFELLAGYAREAVRDRTPYFLRFDAEGNPLRGEYSAEFLNWCNQHAEDPRTVASIQASVYPDDVHFLAKSEDRRGADLFREGLDSPNALVVAFSVEGLGRIQDISSVPLIAKSCDRLPRGAHLSVAMMLPWFGTIEANSLFERLVPAFKTREGLAIQINRIRSEELRIKEGRRAVFEKK